MAMDTQVNSVLIESKAAVGTADKDSTQSKERVAASDNIADLIEPIQKKDQMDKKNQNALLKDKKTAQSSLDSAVSNMNSNIKKTRCEYDFDDPTNTITVKIYDKETDELIREVPPEKSLAAIKKIWEIAGLIVDEKR